jgi:hypothetical protein
MKQGIFNLFDFKQKVDYKTDRYRTSFITH